MSVLMIDDNLDLLQSFEDMLVRMGLNDVACARNGREALAWVKSRSFQLIISDTNMPEMCGVEFLLRLRSSGVPTPVVLLFSGSLKFPSLDAAELHLMGASEVMTKTEFLDVAPYLFKKYLGDFPNPEV